MKHESQTDRGKKCLEWDNTEHTTHTMLLLNIGKRMQGKLYPESLIVAARSLRRLESRE